VNRGEIRNRILDGLSDSFSSPVGSTEAQLNEVIQEASEVLAEEIEAVKRTVFFPLQEGVTYIYTPGLAPDLMMPKRLWNPTTSKPLTAVSLKELDEFKEDWESVVGNPDSWAALSWDIFAIFPHPATAGGVLRLDYLAWPRELLDDDDEPEFPESVQDGIVLYGLYDGLLKRYDVRNGVDMLNGFTEMWTRGKPTSGQRGGRRIFSRVSLPHTRLKSSVREEEI